MAARLSNEQRRYVVKQLTLGSQYAQIQESFEKAYGRTVNVATIRRLRQSNLPAISQGRALIAQEGATSAVLLKQKAHQLIENRLDEAIEDASVIKDLRLQLRAGSITEREFKQKLELYRELTINELTKVSEAMHNQSKGEDPDPVTPQDQAALSALIAGINAGNPVQLIQVLNNRNAPAPV